MPAHWSFIERGTSKHIPQENVGVGNHWGLLATPSGTGHLVLLRQVSFANADYEKCKGAK
ncbi:hypothetical protein B0H12DRAFT_1145019 [Mycena haematopus]|nr:hypothetical protein B0H12DRAFT_1145019 [Mycena haematopus]